MIEIIAPGPLCTIQDLGRPGLAALGVGASGAADRRSLKLANRLVGNPEGAAGLEVTLGGLVARFTEHALIAVTGAPCPMSLDDATINTGSPTYVAAGQTLRMALPGTGLRSYLAVRGGIDDDEVLGSQASDQLAHLGPEPLTPGRLIPIGPAPESQPIVDHAPQQPLPDEPILRVRLGPRDDWFTADAAGQLFSAPYEVTDKANRIGIRLAGPPIERHITTELPSEGMVCGAIQVPPDGQPVLFLADHPVTGGYPVIGVVTDDDHHLAAQVRPGQHIRFRRLP